MKTRHFTAALSVIICLVFSLIERNAVAGEYNNLENELNKIDQPKDWQNVDTSGEANLTSRPANSGWQSQTTPLPPATPTPQSFAPSYNSYMRPGMPYSREQIPALQNSTVWRSMTNPAAYAGPMAGQAGGNPFNLSPFGILHYLWDDTTYVSAANPVTLYQTQNELQTAQQYSRMAQAAASRARYAPTPQERSQAAQQSQYYAGLARQAAQQAQQVSQAGSLNPSDVAAAAAQQAQDAQSYATQATNYAQRGF